MMLASPQEPIPLQTAFPRIVTLLQEFCSPQAIVFTSAVVLILAERAPEAAQILPYCLPSEAVMLKPEVEVQGGS